MSTISAGSSTGIAGALRNLDQALDAPPQPDVPLSSWWSTVRHHLTGLHEALVSETERPEDGWLAAPRGGAVLRLHRLSTLGHDVLDGPEIEALRSEIKRLITDVRHYLQRVHDLAYDAVELELGGSE
jgi:peptidoglycan/xylan/chitin deacetylase (PgdA/CDA1 family)